MFQLKVLVLDIFEAYILAIQQVKMSIRVLAIDAKKPNEKILFALSDTKDNATIVSVLSVFVDCGGSTFTVYYVMSRDPHMQNMRRCSRGCEYRRIMGFSPMLFVLLSF